MAEIDGIDGGYGHGDSLPLDEQKLRIAFAADIFNGTA